ncbi:hypothetical protein [Limosilactobacillus fermentum]|uniref:hypothetical protein n=1 Tax=Limosilactobacillus fermentum TaxID=1613 RepID=UPI0021A7184D|nr:hypothetical protein [Limosilactobacillus fermentum]
MKFKRYTLRFPPGEKERLEAISKVTGNSVSNLILQVCLDNILAFVKAPKQKDH